MKKKLLSILVVFVMVCALGVCAFAAEPATDTWDGTVATDWYTDTVENLTIDTAEELAAFAKLVNGDDEIKTKNQTVTLTVDIDLAGMDWTPIGDENHSFEGTFDGRGHTISNLKVSGEGRKYIGLFGNSSGTIKNVKVKNAELVGCGHVGAIVGHTFGSVYNCSVENVHAISKTQSTANGHDDGDKVGGLIGFVPNEGTGNVAIEGCSAIGPVRIEAYRDAGGFIGYAGTSSKIEGCSISNVTKLRKAGTCRDASLSFL